MRWTLLLVTLAASWTPAAASSDPQSLQDRALTWDGVPIRYVDTRPEGGGTALLFVHGYNGNLTEMMPVLRRLPAAWRLVAVDLPGNGRSGKPDAAYSIPYFADFLAAFAARLGLERFVLVGHSMGGQIAVHFTHRHPDMVERLVLIDPFGLDGEAAAWMPLARSGWILDVAIALNTRLFIEWGIKANLFYDPSKASGELLDAAAEALLTPEGRASTARITREVLGTDPVDALLPEIRQETLLLWGAEDRLLEPKWSQRFASLLPRARLRLVAACGHSPPAEQPEETASLIRDFVAEGGS